MADKTVNDILKERKNQFELWLVNILPSNKLTFVMQLQQKSVDEFINFISSVVIPWENNLDFILKYTLQQCDMKIEEVSPENQEKFKKYMALFIKFVKAIK